MIGQNGDIYIIVFDYEEKQNGGKNDLSKLYAIARNGNVKWQYPLDILDVLDGLIVTANGRILVNGKSGIKAFTQDGVLESYLGKPALQSQEHLILDNNGVVYVYAGNRQIKAIQTDFSGDG